MIDIHSLWIGKNLSNLELLCIKSHLAQEHSFHLWVYDSSLNVPDGMILENANEILPANEIFCYQTGEGKGSVSAFSNVFRYKLLWKHGGWWSDTDVVALKRFDFEERYVFACEREPDGSMLPTTCVIKVPPRSALMEKCYLRSTAVERSTLEWGTIGPKLLGDEILKNKLSQHVQSPDTFCPYDWFRSDFDSLPVVSYAVHFWQEMWRRRGMDKNGSYPGSVFDKLKEQYDVL